MPRPKTYDPKDLALKAMMTFWHKGYLGTSMADLVQATGISRHGIYSDFGSKQNLFVSAFEVYQTEVVTPALAPVEARDANLESIGDYFRHQIDRAVEEGLPGPGCLIANTMTESGTHEPAVLTCIETHQQRLKKAFANALNNSSSGSDTNAAADCLMVFTQGLWSLSRTIEEPQRLYSLASQFVRIIDGAV